MKTENLCDLGLGDEICHQKHDTWGKKNRPVILLKLKTSMKDIVERMRGQDTDWEKIFAKNIW